jgi:hypothetical protein
VRIRRGDSAGVGIGKIPCRTADHASACIGNECVYSCPPNRFTAVDDLLFCR